MVATLQTEVGSQSHCTLADVTSALQCLNGLDRSLMTVELDAGPALTIGGGPEEFVAEIAMGDSDRWAVVDLTRGELRIDLVVGGQSVDYPERLCISREQALEAARVFMNEGGSRSAKLTWSVES